MADTGTLKKLSPGIREHIYTFVLTSPEGFKLKTILPERGALAEDHEGILVPRHLRVFAPRDHHRDPEHRGQMQDEEKCWIVVPSKAALLLTNKSIYAESVSILYGGNRFEFTSMGTLDTFLHQINKRVWPLLRHIAVLSHTEDTHRMSQYPTFTALVSAYNLRSFEISHDTHCHPGYGVHIQRSMLKRLVHDVAPILSAIQHPAILQKRDPAVLDVVRFVKSPRCQGCDLEVENFRRHKHFKRNKHTNRLESVGYVECWCKDDTKNGHLNAMLKEMLSAAFGSGK